MSMNPPQHSGFSSPKRLLSKRNVDGNLFNQMKKPLNEKKAKQDFDAMCKDLNISNSGLSISRNNIL